MASASGQYWVTWKDVGDPAAARKSAILWGPQAHPPAQLSGYFQAGPFATKADAQAYENSIGTGEIIPHAGTPIIGSTSVKSLLPSWSLIFGGFKDWFARGLKIVFGGILIILGVSHLTGLDNKVTQLAGKAVPIPV